MTRRPSSNAPGTKLDQDKLAYHLVDGPAEAWLAATLTYGVAKYTQDGWRSVPNANARYYSALKRHLERWRAGEQLDEESGLHHLACVMFAAMCLTALNAPRDIGEIERAAADACRRWRDSAGEPAAPPGASKQQEATRHGRPPERSTGRAGQKRRARRAAR